MNVHGCGLIPLSYELALFITELGSGGDESINWRGSFFFLSLFLYIYILHPNWKDMKEIKGDCCNREFPHDHSAAAAAAHLWMRIMTNYGLVKEKRGEEKFFTNTNGELERRKKRAIKKFGDDKILRLCAYIPICIPNPPNHRAKRERWLVRPNKFIFLRKVGICLGKKNFLSLPKKKRKKTFESSLVPFDRKARPSHSWLVIIDRPRLSLPVGK